MDGHALHIVCKLQISACWSAMRFIRASYSSISRMEAEAVHVHDASLRCTTKNCTHLKTSEIIRHLEDEFSKAEMKCRTSGSDVERAGQSFGASASNSE